MSSNSGKTWFITNVHSGSYDPDQCERIVDDFARAGWEVSHVVRFPEDDLPDRDQLEAAGVGTLGIFTGDGTINSLLHKAAGWDGQVLVLPGGTMNLLCKALHDSEDIDAIIARARQSPARRNRSRW